MQGGETRPGSDSRPTLKSNRGTLAFIVLAIIFGAFMIATGPVLASQSQSHQYEADISPTNFTLPPGVGKFWFGEGNNGGGVRHIVYFAVTSPSTSNAEFRVTVMGAVNGTIFSTQSDYTQTDFTIPIGTKEVNYTIFNPTGAPLTVVAAEVRFFEIDYPNLWFGSSVLYLGIAIVVAGLLGLGLWVRPRMSVQSSPIP